MHGSLRHPAESVLPLNIRVCYLPFSGGNDSTRLWRFSFISLSGNRAAKTINETKPILRVR